MKNKNVMTLVAVGAVLAAMAWMTSREKTLEAPSRIGSRLLPGLAVNAVDEIIIATAAETSRVVKAESGWQIPDRFGYPANFEVIRQLMLKLETLKIGQLISANDKQRDQMGLSPTGATTLTLKAGGNAMTTLLLGANRQAQNADAGPYGMGAMPDGRFIGIKDDPSAYLVGDVLYEADADVTRWMDTSLLDVSPDAVTSITIENPGDGAFTLHKGEDGKLVFDPASESVSFDDSKAYTLTGALSGLTLQDVADPSLDDKALGFETNRLFRIQTQDGICYNIRASEPVDDSGDRHIRINVVLEAPPAIVPANDKENAAQDAAAKAAALEEAKTKASALQAKLSPWTFRIASYKANTFASTRESLIRKDETTEGKTNEQ